MNLNAEEAQILADNQILVPPAWHLPHDRNMSAGGYAIAPHYNMTLPTATHVSVSKCSYERC
jgi:hypothetical protein